MSSPQAAWGCFHWRNSNDSTYAIKAGDFHFPWSCGMRQDPRLSRFTALDARGPGSLQDQAHDHKELLLGVGSDFSPQNLKAVSLCRPE